MSQDRSKLYGVNVDWTTGNPGVVSADVVKLTARQVVVSRSLNALGYKTTIRLIDGEPEKGAWTPEGAAKRYRDDCAEAVTGTNEGANLRCRHQCTSEQADHQRRPPPRHRNVWPRVSAQNAAPL